MPPFFIFLLTMIGFLVYLLTQQWYVLTISMAFQISWVIWFLTFSGVSFHLYYEHTRVGAITWCCIYTVVEIGILLRDVNVIPKNYFFILLALSDIVISVGILIMVCNTLRDKGRFWSSNLLELCSIVWVSSQIVRGVVIMSGIPILFSIAFIRFVQDGSRKELAVWVCAIGLEWFFEPTLTYGGMLVLLLMVFLYIYRHVGILIILTPLVCVGVFILFCVNVGNTRTFTTAYKNTKMDLEAINRKFGDRYGKWFLSLPTRADPVTQQTVSTWW